MCIHKRISCVYTRDLLCMHNTLVHALGQGPQGPGTQKRRGPGPGTGPAPFLGTIRNYAKLCETMRNYAKLCETMRNYTKLYKTMRNYAKLCKTMQNYAKLWKLDAQFRANVSICTRLRIECSLPEFSRESRGSLGSRRSGIWTAACDPPSSRQGPG